MSDMLPDLREVSWKMIRANRKRKTGMVKDCRIVCSLLGLAILVPLLLSYLGDAFLVQDDSGGGFYSFYREKAPIDVMVFGSSHAACTVNNAILFDEAGIASYTLSAGSQPIPLTYYYMKEAFSVQKPKVAMVETLSLDSEEPDPESGKYSFPEGAVYRSVLSMRWSPAYLSMILDLDAHYSIPEETKNAYLWKWQIIHTGYKDLSYDQVHHVRSYIRGYKGDSSTGSGERPQVTEECGKVSGLVMEYLEKIIDLCEEENVQLIFFTAPYPCTEEDTARENSVEKLAKEKGIPFINFNKGYDQYQLDFSTDLRSDNNHLNNTGAAKVTRALLAILKDYNLPDRRGDSRYEAWKLHETFLDNKDVTARLQTDDFTEYVNILQEYYDRYMIVLCMTGNYNAQQVDTYKNALLNLGLAGEDYDRGGMLLLDHGRVRWYSGNEVSWNQEFETAGRRITLKGMNEKAASDENLTVTEASFNGNTIPLQGLWLNEDTYSLPENGFSFLVYDDGTDQVIDFCSLDVYTENTLMHG